MEYKENEATKENNYTPHDDTFALLRFGTTNKYDDALNQVYDNIDSAIRRSIEKNIDLTNLWIKANGTRFSQKYFVHIIAGIFKYHNTIELLIDQLLRNEFGIHNDKHGKLKLNVNKSTLENVQFIRLQWHIVGVLLSLPRNPLNTLLHNPQSFSKRYLVGMPEFQGNDLLTAMSSFY